MRNPRGICRWLGPGHTCKYHLKGKKHKRDGGGRDGRAAAAEGEFVCISFQCDLPLVVTASAEKNASSQMIPGRRDIESGEQIRGADLMMI